MRKTSPPNNEDLVADATPATVEQPRKLTYESPDIREVGRADVFTLGGCYWRLEDRESRSRCDA